MKYKKYPSYKDSGVSWLCEIPIEWNITKVKHKFLLGRGRVISLEELEEEGEYPVYSSQTKNNGILGYINSYDFDCKQITWTTDGANAGTVFLREGKHNCTNVCGTLLPIKKNENLEYLTYTLGYATTFYKRPDTNGAKIMNGEMSEIFLTFPPVEEQQQIANFLDKATAKIDTLIEKQTKQIELLKEKRQAVISHAVTKGINPNVPMKDSGVEWLGEIPEHWEVSKLKFYTNVKGRIGFRGYTKDDLVSKEEGALVIGASEMNNNAKLEIKKPQYISWYKYYESPEIILNQGDLLFVQRGSTVGKVAHIDFDIEEATINPSLVVLKRIKLNPFYLKYYLLSNLIKAIVKVETSNTAIPMISQEQIGNYTLSFPKKEDEQQQIVNYLDEKTSKIDTLIEKSNKSIELLKEKRTALISAAVTGKIDVREFV